MRPRPDDGGSKNFWNVGKNLLDYMSQHPRRQSSSNATSWNCHYLVIFEYSFFWWPWRATLGYGFLARWFDTVSSNAHQSLCSETFHPSSYPPLIFSLLSYNLSSSSNNFLWAFKKSIEDIKMAVFCPHDGSIKHLWNVGELIPDYTPQQPRWQLSVFTSPWEPEIWHYAHTSCFLSVFVSYLSF
jgi:hypothetical protein